MRFLLILAGLFVCNISFAAPDPPPPIPPPVGLPIDNGAVILFAISVLFGCYKIYSHTKRATLKM